MNTKLRIAVAGKSNFVVRFFNNVFAGDYDPTIEDSYRKEITIGTERHVVDILDTAYDEEYSSLRQRYLRVMNGIIICVPIDKDIDFNNLEIDFMDPILRVKDVDRYDPVMVVVTKMDLEAEPGAKMLSEEKLQKFTQKYGMPIAYTSAKEGKGVNDAIERMVELCLEDLKKMAAEARAEMKPKRRTNCSVM